jgi:hypothetical protein
MNETGNVSPYKGLKIIQWRKKTLRLIEAHPIKVAEFVEVTLDVWEDVFRSGIGRKPFRIGVDIFPKPQIMGFLLHELIPLEFARRYPSDWRGEFGGRDKDLVYVPDAQYSVEIKTSSHPSKIFGNRSYAQESESTKKSKSGYYLAVNFGKCEKCENPVQPKILRIRFGWLDASDWRGQKAASGQQANLAPEVEEAKLIEIFPKRHL